MSQDQSNPVVITPTVGRIVWLRPKGNHRTLLQVSDDSQPAAAIVTRVWGDRMINVTAFSQNSGDPVPLTSVRLLQGDGNDAPQGEVETVAEWMPYQKGQAAKVAQAPQPPVNNAHVAPGCDMFTGTAVGLTFGDALAVLKAGGKVARAGWNGKGMWLSLSCGETREIPAASFWSPHNRAHAEAQGGMAKVLPSITMKTATGEILMGWLASQTDMLADDWQALDVEVPAGEAAKG